MEQPVCHPMRAATDPTLSFGVSHPPKAPTSALHGQPYINRMSNTIHHVLQNNNLDVPRAPTATPHGQLHASSVSTDMSDNLVPAKALPPHYHMTIWTRIRLTLTVPFGPA